MSEATPGYRRGPSSAYADGYEAGYRDGESNREADAVAYHEEVVGHTPICNCPLGAFLRHIGATS